VNLDKFDKNEVHFVFDLPSGMMEELYEQGIVEPLAQELLKKLQAHQPTYKVRFDRDKHSIDVLVNLDMVQDLLDELVVCLYGDEEWPHEWETLRNTGWSDPVDEED
jgi:hypothetical protein